jgi:hypothetical protein
MVVWISMMDSDVYDAARAGAQKLPDPRIRFFFDPGQLLGKTIAAAQEYPGEVAWDMYLFYAPDLAWEESAPIPEAYMHQLSDTWADQSRLFQDLELSRELRAELLKLVNRYED